MSTNKHLWMVVGSMILFLGLGGSLLVWPNYRRAHRLNAEIAALDHKIETVGSDLMAVEKLAADVEIARFRFQTECKHIPDSADIAGLIRKLSLSVDGATVKDQTFNAGSPSEAFVGQESNVMVMPLTVDMEANFEAVFDLLLRAEAMNRLVRLSTVRMSCERQKQEDLAGPPVLTASVGLEAVFEPPLAQEGR